MGISCVYKHFADVSCTFEDNQNLQVFTMYVLVRNLREHLCEGKTYDFDSI